MATLTAEELRLINRTKLIAVGLIASGLVFIGVFASLAMSETIRLYPKSMAPDKLDNFASKIEYALRYQTLQVLWLIFNVHATMFGRLKNNAINPLFETTEQYMQGHKNILTNSVESAIISVLAQLIFVSYAESSTILWFIPYVNLVQFIGRIAFFVGYPNRRAFGYSCTAFTNVCMTGYIVYKFASGLNQ